MSEDEYSDSTRAFLFAVAQTVGELMLSRPITLDEFRELLKFHVRNVAFVLPEASQASFDSEVEEMHRVLVRFVENHQRDIASLSSSEFQEGVGQRHVRRQILETLYDDESLIE